MANIANNKAFKEFFTQAKQGSNATLGYEPNANSLAKPSSKTISQKPKTNIKYSHMEPIIQSLDGSNRGKDMVKGKLI